MTIPPLFAHQVISVDFMRGRKRALDLSDPGTGKTRVEIEDFSQRRKKGGGCALVIAPRSLLRSAWEDDFRKFAPWIKVSVAFASNRAKAFAQKADVYITNTDAAAWLKKQSPHFFSRFDTLIIDEITAFKHHTSKRSRALASIRHYFEYRRGMTGTPNSNSLTDVWHQAMLIDDGKQLGTSFFRFQAATCTPIQVGPRPEMRKWEVKPGMEAVVAKMLEPITIRHRFEDCVSIPENHEYVVNYYMTSAQIDHYKEMARDMVLQLAPQIIAGKLGVRSPEIMAVNAAVLAQKLLQISSGAVYDDVGHYHLTDGARYELIADLVQQRQHCLVFFLWKHQRERLMWEFHQRGITWTVVDSSANDRERDEAVKHFQLGYYKVFLAHPASAAHGLTLTRGTSTIWSSPTYNLEHFLQGNWRINRIGQTQKTETVVVIAPDTIEERVYFILSNKNAKQSDLLNLFAEGYGTAP